MIKFSLLLCVYAKETPAFFSQCLNSILAQTILPDQLIIVKDGLLPDELETVLREVRFLGETTVISLPKSVTLGPARAEGVKAANHEWVAIMDSDDICCHDRFEKQLKILEDNPQLGLIGGQISEFTNTPGDATFTRIVPTTHDEICRFVKKRNPFNSMTVMFRREMVLSAGNYGYFPWFEDYDLWARMIKNGVLCANHLDVLVHARVGNGMYERRRGMTYIKSEWQMQKQLRRYALINSLEFARNVVMRIPVRLLPVKSLALVYNRFTRGGMSH